MITLHRALLLGLARASSDSLHGCNALVKLVPLFEALHQPGLHGKARAQMPRGNGRKALPGEHVPSREIECVQLERYCSSAAPFRMYVGSPNSLSTAPVGTNPRLR